MVTDFAGFCKERGLTIDVKNLGVETEDSGGGRQWTYNSYRVTLKYKSRQLTTSFKQGLAHKEDPEAHDVLGCMLVDASSVAGVSFEDFCSEFGYDPDSRRAEKLFKDCNSNAKKLIRFLGTDIEDFAIAARDW